MRLQEILFTGMNVMNEARNILGQFEVTQGMTDGECKAYEMGVENTLRIIEALLERDDHMVFHLKDSGVAAEFDLDDLIEFVEEKEGYQYE